MNSKLISRTSAIVLFAGGAVLLFAPEVLLARLITGFPAAGFWLGQLVGAGWLAVAALNWLSQSAFLGGIYGRPVVFANVALYFISALVLVKAGMRSDAPRGLWILAAPVFVLAVTYGWLLMRGPIQRDIDKQRAA